MGTVCSNVKNNTYDVHKTQNTVRSKRNVHEYNEQRATPDKKIVVDASHNNNLNNDNKKDEFYMIDFWQKTIIDDNNDKNSVLESLAKQSNVLLNKEFSTGEFAIHVCARKGYWSLLNQLLIFGDNITKKNSKNGNTALHYAVEGLNLRIVFFLAMKSNGKLIGIKNNNNELPYDIAKKINDDDLINAVNPKYKEIYRENTDPDNNESEPTPKKSFVVDENYETSDEWSSIDYEDDEDDDNNSNQSNGEGYFKYLLNDWQKSQDNNKEDCETVFALLHQCSAKFINYQTKDGDFAIHICAKKGYKETISWLLLYGHDATKKNSKNGNTALHYAVEANNLELVRYLLYETAFGAQLIETKNNNNKLPYDLAIQTNNKYLIKLVTPQDKRG